LISITRLPGCATKGANWLPFPSPSFRPTRIFHLSSDFSSPQIFNRPFVRLVYSVLLPTCPFVRLVYSYRCFFRIPFTGASSEFPSRVLRLLRHSLLGSATSSFPSRVCFFCIPFLGPATSAAFPSQVLFPSFLSTWIFYSPSVRPGNILQFQGHPLLHQLEDHNYHLPSLQLKEPLIGHPSSYSHPSSSFQLIHGLLGCGVTNMSSFSQVSKLIQFLNGFPLFFHLFHQYRVLSQNVRHLLSQDSTPVFSISTLLVSLFLFILLCGCCFCLDFLFLVNHNPQFSFLLYLNCFLGSRVDVLFQVVFLIQSFSFSDFFMCQ